MTEEAHIDVRLEKSTDDSGGDVQRGRVKVRVSDQSGSPLSASVTVSGQSYEKQKQSGSSLGTASFENVPMPATVLIEKTGYKSMTIDVDESDLGGDDIVRGY